MNHSTKYFKTTCFIHDFKFLTLTEDVTFRTFAFILGALSFLCILVYPIAKLLSMALSLDKGFNLFYLLVCIPCASIFVFSSISKTKKRNQQKKNNDAFLKELANSASVFKEIGLNQLAEMAESTIDQFCNEHIIMKKSACSELVSRTKELSVLYKEDPCSKKISKHSIALTKMFVSIYKSSVKFSIMSAGFCDTMNDMSNFFNEHRHYDDAAYFVVLDHDIHSKAKTINALIHIKQDTKSILIRYYLRQLIKALNESFDVNVSDDSLYFLRGFSKLEKSYAQGGMGLVSIQDNPSSLIDLLSDNIWFLKFVRLSVLCKQLDVNISAMEIV